MINRPITVIGCQANDLQWNTIILKMILQNFKANAMDTVKIYGNDYNYNQKIRQRYVFDDLLTTDVEIGKDSPKASYPYVVDWQMTEFEEHVKVDSSRVA